MNESLYLQQPVVTDKTASAEATLPEDANTWPTEILQELFSQVPYIADFDPQVVMDKVDAERGYGFGHVEVQNKSEMQNSASGEDRKQLGIQRVRVPIIIKERRLQPLDVLVTAGSKALPLTENRLRQALFRPQAFDVTGKTPGDPSMVNQLYPPNRQNNMSMGKESSIVGVAPTNDQFHDKLEKVLGLTPQEMAKLKAQHAPQIPVKTAGIANASIAQPVGPGVKALLPKTEHMKVGSILAEILPTIAVSDFVAVTDKLEDPGTWNGFLKNASTHEPVKLLLSYEPDLSDKTAAALDELAPTVMQVVKESQGYRVKMANPDAWAPRELLVDRGFIVEEFGTKVALAADTEGSVTMTEGEGASASPEENRAELIAGFGYYNVQTEDGEELQGFVFPNLYDVDGKAMPMALFTDQAHATVQDAIVGERVTEGVPELAITGGPPQGHGVFVRMLNGTYEATIPFTVSAGYNSGGAQQYQAETFDGRPVMLSVQEGGQLKVPQQVDDTCIIPSDYQWLSLGESDDVALVNAVDAWNAPKEAQRSLAAVTVRAGGPNDFWLEGEPLSKVAAQALNLDDTLFLLGALGTDLSYGAQKLAEAVYRNQPIQVKVARAIIPASRAAARIKEAQATLPEFIVRADLVKEAAFIQDPTAVDTVLSLGFINPENMHTFVSYLPQVEQSLSRLCELLIAARLGMSDVPVGPLEKCVRTMDEAIDGLKVLAFMKQ